MRRHLLSNFYIKIFYHYDQAAEVIQLISGKELLLYTGFTFWRGNYYGAVKDSTRWYCSSRTKHKCTVALQCRGNKILLVKEIQLPEWTSIYYMKVADKENELKCNLCEDILYTHEKSLEILDHIKHNHIDIYNLHKDNPQANVGFRIEFLHLNVMKDDDDNKSQPIILGEVCEAETVTLPKVPEPVTDRDDEINTQYVLFNKKKKKKSVITDTRKRSWVWKYFYKLSNIIYRCNLCHVVLSIKGCNTNNMNRHIRTRHPQTYKKEMVKRDLSDNIELSGEIDTPFAIKTEEIYASDRDMEEIIESPSQKLRRSWIWSYFERVSATQAQCKLCRRHITHGGNATGNMNRHLKMIHNKTGYQDDEKSNSDWVWKVFTAEEDANTCKICQCRCIKYEDKDKNITHMLQHLKQEHGVVSGDQIITGADCNELQ